MAQGIDFQDKLILAPMAGVTDLPFRLLCKEQGCDILYTEMVSAKAIYYGNRNTEPLIRYEQEELPLGLQLFGSEPELMAEMALRMEERGYTFIDVNMGCPVPKIFNNGEGSALMKDPQRIGAIVAAMVKKLSIPLTIKIRKGIDEEHVNAVEVAKIAEANGAAAIAVHGRTRVQYYAGEADWDIIRRVKEAVGIPVIGNGDVKSVADVRRMKEETGCDAVMIGRGAKGNPWIFRRDYEGKPDRDTVIAMMRRHLELMVRYKGEYTGIHEMRKHVAWYTLGYPHATKLRGIVNQVESVEELEQLLDRWGNDRL